MDVERSRGTLLRRARARSEAGETAFALLDGLWHAPVGIAFLDRGLRLVQVNEAFAKLAGLAAAALAGRRARDLFGGDDAVAAATEQRRRAVMASGQPALDVGATSRDRRTARVRTWRASVYPVLAPSGEVRGVCAVVDETTHVRERELELERARTAADRGRPAARAARRPRGGALAPRWSPRRSPPPWLEPRALGDGRRGAVAPPLEAEGLVPLAARGAAAEGSNLRARDRPGERLPVADALAGEQGVWLESADALATRYPHLVGASRAPTGSRRPRRSRSARAAARSGRSRSQLPRGTLLRSRGPGAPPRDRRSSARRRSTGRGCSRRRGRRSPRRARGGGAARGAPGGDRRRSPARARRATSRRSFVEGATCGSSGPTWRRRTSSTPRARRVIAPRAPRPRRGRASPATATFRLDAPYPAPAAVRTGAAALARVLARHHGGVPGAQGGRPRPLRTRPPPLALPLRAGARRRSGPSRSGSTAAPVRPGRDARFLESVADQCGAGARPAPCSSSAERAQRAAAERDRAALDGIFENAPLGIGLYDSRPSASCA